MYVVRYCTNLGDERAGEGEEAKVFDRLVRIHKGGQEAIQQQASPLHVVLCMKKAYKQEEAIRESIVCHRGRLLCGTIPEDDIPETPLHYSCTRLVSC